MANYALLKVAIQQVVKTNGNNEITGALLQQTLFAMVDSLGGYYQFAGIATPSTNPGTPDQNVFYLASTAGTYSNFGSIVLAENEAAILKYNGTWSKDSSGFATSEKVSQLGAKVDKINLTSDFGTDGDDALSFVDENDNCIAQFKDGHIKTKEFDSRDAVTETDLQNGLNAFAETTVQKDNEDNNEGALAFVDENDECIAQFKDGHIKTKKFDSRDSLTTDNEDENDESLAFVDENDNGLVQFKDGHIKTKNFDSRNFQAGKTKFASLGMDSLQILGTSSKTNDVISIASGVSNRVQIPADLQAWYYKILCTVKCTSGTAGITIGKNGYYGTLFTVSGSSLIVKLNGNDQEAVSIGFTLELNRVYTVTVSHNVSTSKVDTFEIYDDFGNYFSYSTPYTAHSYGNPVVYSETAAMQMTRFAMSMQERYNPNFTKMIVTGHSYVEADSLGSNRESCFVSLLDNYNGDNSVVNCGLGGDTVSAMNNKMPYFIKMCPNTEYILMCVGGNDRTATADQIIEGLETALSIVISTNKTPVLFTINPASAGYDNAAFPTVNTWIRQSGFHYVDMDKVFYNPNGTINQSLYLQDGLHPTIEGHLRIFRRIQMDCPFLF